MISCLTQIYFWLLPSLQIYRIFRKCVLLQLQDKNKRSHMHENLKMSSILGIVKYTSVPVMHLICLQFCIYNVKETMAVFAFLLQNQFSWLTHWFFATKLFLLKPFCRNKTNLICVVQKMHFMNIHCSNISLSKRLIVVEL